MSCFGGDSEEAILIAIPKNGNQADIQGPLNGHLIDRHFSPKEAAMIHAAMAGAVKMPREADHEKISRQYREGKLGKFVGFEWYTDERRPDVKT